MIQDGINWGLGMRVDDKNPSSMGIDEYEGEFSMYEDDADMSKTSC